MRMKPNLEEAIERAVEDLSKRYPGYDAHELLVEALYGNMAMKGIEKACDFLIEEGFFEERKVRSAA